MLLGLFLTISIVAIAFLSMLKLNPPLEIGTLASNEDTSTLVIGVGNKGWQSIRIDQVIVNQHEKPTETKIQHSNALQGFTITEDFTNENVQDFGFQELKDVSILPKTSHSSIYEKQDQGLATELDEIYGISLRHNQAIHDVNIHYHYFGIPMHVQISTNNF